MNDSTTFCKSYETPLVKENDIDFESYLVCTNMLTDEEIFFLTQSIEIKTFKKGTFLLQEGQVANICYQNLKGCVREFYLLDGEEKTTEFYTEGHNIASSHSSQNRTPVSHYWECLEDTTVSAMPYDLELEMYRRFPRIERMCRMEVESQLGAFREKMAFFINSTPEQRYLNLLQNRPDLLYRVPQYQLASFIGVKPESLSRIRGRIRNGVTAV
jgi:CRP-like cAMP-binding protein